MGRCILTEKRAGPQCTVPWLVGSEKCGRLVREYMRGHTGVGRVVVLSLSFLLCFKCRTKLPLCCRHDGVSKRNRKNRNVFSPLSFTADDTARRHLVARRSGAGRRRCERIKKRRGVKHRARTTCVGLSPPVSLFFLFHIILCTQQNTCFIYIREDDTAAFLFLWWGRDKYSNSCLF